MKRLYYLTDSLEVTSQISEDLRLAGIRDWNFHVLSKDDAGLYQRHIHSATGFQRLDIIHCCEQGALLGVLMGLALAAVLWWTQPASFPISMSLFLLVLSVAILFGIWAGGMMGVTHEHYKLRRFHDDLERGRHLIMIDIRHKQKEQVLSIVEQHPQARAAGEDSTFINPFRLA